MNGNSDNRGDGVRRVARKRPLVSRTNQRGIAPPPTATARRLTKILDGKDRKKRRLAKPKRKVADEPSGAIHPPKPPSSLVAPPSRNPFRASSASVVSPFADIGEKKKKDAFSFGGGLASVPKPPTAAAKTPNHKTQPAPFPGSRTTTRPKHGKRPRACSKMGAAKTPVRPAVRISKSGLVRAYSTPGLEPPSNTLVVTPPPPSVVARTVTDPEIHPQSTTTPTIRPAIETESLALSSPNDRSSPSPLSRPSPGSSRTSDPEPSGCYPDPATAPTATPHPGVDRHRPNDSTPGARIPHQRSNPASQPSRETSADRTAPSACTVAEAETSSLSPASVAKASSPTNTTTHHDTTIDAASSLHRVGLTLATRKTPKPSTRFHRQRPLGVLGPPDRPREPCQDDEDGSCDRDDTIVLEDPALLRAARTPLERPSASETERTTATADGRNPLAPGDGPSRSLTQPFRADPGTSRRPKKHSINDNFVRLNLRNSAGACRGARNKKSFRKGRYRDRGDSYPNRNDSENGNAPGGGSSSAAGGTHGQAYVSRMSGLDPLDDYLDGVFGRGGGIGPRSNRATTPDHPPKTDSSQPSEVPKCARHQRPCKLVVVKTNKRGNKGRKFYACSMPRGEQCDHFQWAEDTLEAARKAISNNSSHSSFVARQVAAHVERFKVLTVPELRQEAAQRGLNKTGKKSSLLLRLALWARDEIVRAVPDPTDEDHDEMGEKEREKETGEDSLVGAAVEKGSHDLGAPIGPDSDDDTCASESSDGESESSGELQFFDEEGEDDDGDSDKEDGDHTLCLDGTENDSALNHEDTSTDSRLKKTLRSVFGHSRFRDGQEWAIERCLAGKKSLLVAPTGFGKSLCYALPASLMDGVCVVVSPLISLIQDQLRSLPPSVPAATLSGSVSASGTAAILDDVIRKRIKILFVSPERLTSPSFKRLFYQKWNPELKQKERKFPEISLLCIDEAHCVSQWAHNFRPCFLRFRGLLRIMKPQSILAVTATAGPRVIDDISTTLGIDESQLTCQANEQSLPDEKSILVIDKPRDNIDVACQYVGSHEERLDMLSKILKPRIEGKARSCKYSGTLAEGAVIVYVWRQRDTEVVAENLLSSGVAGGVVMYHGGMDASARSKAQSKFMRGKARICVATVAFGMGIDKADVVGVVHLYLSSSPEHYLQEIGRAGRDGRQARAIALPTIEEISIRHSLVHSNFICKSQIRALLEYLKDVVKDATIDGETGALHIALPVDNLVIACDCKSETIETLLSILEQSGGENAVFSVEGFNYDKATIALKKRSLKKLAEFEEVAACIHRVGECCDPPIGKSDQLEDSHQQSRTEPFQRHFLAYSRGSYTFSVTKCANALGPSAEPRHVFAALRRLQSSNELELALDTSAKGRVFHLKVSQHGAAIFRNTSFESYVTEVIEQLEEKFISSVNSSARKVLDMNFVMGEVASASLGGQEIQKNTLLEKSVSLHRFQDLVTKYFTEGFQGDSVKSRSNTPKTFCNIRSRELENDVVALLRDLPVLVKQAPDNDFAPVLGGLRFPDYTAIALTKFLHGLDSPRAPIQAFRNHPLYGKWREVQFALVLKAINLMLQTS